MAIAIERGYKVEQAENRLNMPRTLHLQKMWNKVICALPGIDWEVGFGNKGIRLQTPKGLARAYRETLVDIELASLNTVVDPYYKGDEHSHLADLIRREEELRNGPRIGILTVSGFSAK